MTKAEAVQAARDRLTAYKEAELSILRGAQSYTISGQVLTRANLAEIRKGIKEAQNDLLMLLNGGGLVIGQFVPVDN